MSDIVRALILGIVQGLTEFLPVSSSGHLEIANELMGSNDTIDSDLLMVILVHLGTAFSICYVFRHDIGTIIKDLFQFKNTDSTQLSFKIVLSMIPAIVIGLLFDEQLEILFSGDILWVGLFLMFTAIVLYFTPSVAHDTNRDVSYGNAAVVGLAQAVAILPGVSRSGMTIATALYLKVSREKAARFSFLMVLPVIFGKVILDVLSGDLSLSEANWAPIAVSLISSFLVGVWACKWMVNLVKNSQLSYFAYYCFFMGILTVLYHCYG